MATTLPAVTTMAAVSGLTLREPTVAHVLAFVFNLVIQFFVMLGFYNCGRYGEITFKLPSWKSSRLFLWALLVVFMIELVLSMIFVTMLPLVVVIGILGAVLFWMALPALLMYNVGRTKHIALGWPARKGDGFRLVGIMLMGWFASVLVGMIFGMMFRM